MPKVSRFSCGVEWSLNPADVTRFELVVDVNVHMHVHSNIRGTVVRVTRSILTKRSVPLIPFSLTLRPGRSTLFIVQKSRIPSLFPRSVSLRGVATPYFYHSPTGKVNVTRER